MRLIGLPLILLGAALTAGAVAGTVRWWRRMPVRIIGLIALEVLLVLETGLIVNRVARFYPSWQALGGTSSAEFATSMVAGRLDGVAVGETVWTPDGVADWGLAARPVVVVPPDYADHPDWAFPVIVVLGGVVPAPVDGVLIVVLAPTVRTGVASLGAVRGALGLDFRTADGVAVVADTRWAFLGAAWPGCRIFRDSDSARRELPSPLAAPRKLPS